MTAEMTSAVSVVDLDDDDLVDIRGVCVLVGGTSAPISQATAYRMIKRGALPGPDFKEGKIHRWRVGNIRRLRRSPEAA